MIGGYYDLSNSLRSVSATTKETMANWSKMLLEKSIPSYVPLIEMVQMTELMELQQKAILNMYPNPGASLRGATPPPAQQLSISNSYVACYLSNMIGCHVSNLDIISMEDDLPHDTIVVECRVNPEINMWKHIRDNSSMYEHVELNMERGGMSTLKATIPMSSIWATRYEGVFVDEPIYVEPTDEEEMRHSLSDEDERSNREWALEQHKECSG